jgi:hypothetical protein
MRIKGEYQLALVAMLFLFVMIFSGWLVGHFNQ